MVKLTAAYYSVPKNEYYCLYDKGGGKCSAMILRGGKWSPITDGKKACIATGSLLDVERELRLWLMKNDPAASKLNYVATFFPDCEKIVTPLKNIILNPCV
jgi:hypothetical protein